MNYDGLHQSKNLFHISFILQNIFEDSVFTLCLYLQSEHFFGDKRNDFMNFHNNFVFLRVLYYVYDDYQQLRRFILMENFVLFFIILLLNRLKLNNLFRFFLL